MNLTPKIRAAIEIASSRPLTQTTRLLDDFKELFEK